MFKWKPGYSVAVFFSFSIKALKEALTGLLGCNLLLLLRLENVGYVWVSTPPVKHKCKSWELLRVRVRVRVRVC